MLGINFKFLLISNRPNSPISLNSICLLIIEIPKLSTSSLGIELKLAANILATAVEIKLLSKRHNRNQLTQKQLS